MYSLSGNHGTIYGSNQNSKVHPQLGDQIKGEKGHINQQASMRSSKSNIDPYTAEIWQMIANPKTEEPDNEPPASPGLSLVNPKAPITSKIGALVQAQRLGIERKLSANFIKSESFTKKPPSIHTSIKLPLLSPSKATFEMGSKLAALESAGDLTPRAGIPSTSSTKRNLNVLTKKHSMPLRTSHQTRTNPDLDYRSDVLQITERSSEGMASQKLTSPTDGAYYYASRFEISSNKRTPIKEFRTTESDLFSKNGLGNTSASNWASTTQFRFLGDQQGKKELTSKGSVISPTKKNTHSQSMAIKGLLSQGSIPKSATTPRDVSYLNFEGNKHESLTQKVSDILGEKLSKEFQLEKQLPLGTIPPADHKETETLRVLPATRPKIVQPPVVVNSEPATLLSTLLHKAANNPSQNLLAASSNNSNPACEISFGAVSRNGLANLSSDSAKLPAEIDIPWSGCSPLSEAEVSSLANHSTDFYSLSCKFSHLAVTNESLLYSLHKQIPNLLQNKPSNRHEATELRQWYFRQMESAGSGSDNREVVCKLTVLESLRQFYVTFGQRALLIMVALQELLGSYLNRYVVKKKQLEHHQTYFYDTLGSKAATFDVEMARQQKLIEELEEKVASLTKELNTAKERIAEKHIIELK
jgi:hypothetical protein